MSRSTASYLLGAALALAIVGVLLWTPRDVPPKSVPNPRPRVPPAAHAADPTMPLSEQPEPEPAAAGVSPRPPAAHAPTSPSEPDEAPACDYDATALSAQLLRQDAASEALMQSWRGNGGPRPAWLAAALRDGSIRAALLALVLDGQDPVPQLALGLLAEARPYSDSEGAALLAAFEQSSGTARRGLVLELVRADYQPLVGVVARNLREAYDADSIAEFRLIASAWPEHPEVWRSLREVQSLHPEDGELAAELTRFGNRPEALDARRVWGELLVSEHAVVRREAVAHHVWLPEELSLLEGAILAHPELLNSVRSLREMPAFFDAQARAVFFANLNGRFADNPKAQQLLGEVQGVWAPNE